MHAIFISLVIDSSFVVLQCLHNRVTVPSFKTTKIVIFWLSYTTVLIVPCAVSISEMNIFQIFNNQLRIDFVPFRSVTMTTNAIREYDVFWNIHIYWNKQCRYSYQLNQPPVPNLLLQTFLHTHGLHILVISYFIVTGRYIFQLTTLTKYPIPEVSIIESLEL